MANKIYIKLIKWANKQIFIERNIEQAKENFVFIYTILY